MYSFQVRESAAEYRYQIFDIIDTWFFFPQKNIDTLQIAHNFSILLTWLRLDKLCQQNFEYNNHIFEQNTEKKNGKTKQLVENKKIIDKFKTNLNL